jgi:ArsR family transcriptional regulator
MQVTKTVTTLEAKLFATLANPKRLEILHLLWHQPLTVSEVMQMTGMPQANVSQHLSVLRRFGVVTSKKEGQTRTYSLASISISTILSAARKSLTRKYGLSSADELSELELHQDPVCGMEIVKAHAAESLLFSRQKYYFCGVGCATEFKDNPLKYVQKRGDARLWQN